MAVIICMLRGVNLGPHKRIKMEALRALCESIKCRGAQTYVQSGNVIFRTDARDLAKLTTRLEKAIEKEFGFHSDVILRTTAELKDAVARNPFANRRGIEPKKLLVTFLDTEPSEDARKQVNALKTDPEEVHVVGREMYIYFPNGMARPKLPLVTIERVLNVRGTGRNWNSATKMLEMAEKMEVS
jgi:uncharacterized protein (DUF1697 family)